MSTGDDRRRRIATACEICRKRKRKNEACLYILERPKKRKRDPDYISALEDQLAFLKAEIRRLEGSTELAEGISGTSQDGEQQEAQGGDAPSVSAATGTEPTASDEGSSGSAGPETTAIDDVSAMMWRMTIGETGETTFIGPSGNFCFPVPGSSLVGSTARSQGTKLSSLDGKLWGDLSKPGPGSSEQIPTDPGGDAPSRKGIAQTLISLFMTHINPVHQIVNARDFSSPDTLNDSSAEDLPPELEFLKCAILAAGALYSAEPLQQALGTEMAARAEALALRTSRLNPCVEVVQALSMLCWRELALDNENMAWMYNAMATSLAVHLGLSANLLGALGSGETNGGGTVATASQQVRLRTFWSCLFLDRIATSLLGRHPLIPWQRVYASRYLDVLGPELPKVDEIVFDSQCRLWFIHDKYMDQIYSFHFHALSLAERKKLLLDAREQLLSFYRTLDPTIRFPLPAGNEPSASFFFLHMSYNMSQILIHRPYLSNQTTPSTSSTSLQHLALRTMATAASATVRLVKNPHYSHHPSPFVVHSILTAAVALLVLSATTSAAALPRKQSIRRLRVLFEALEAMLPLWPKRASRGIAMLRGLARRWDVVAALPMRHSFFPPSETETPAAGAEVTMCARTAGFEAPDVLGDAPLAYGDDLDLGSWDWGEFEGSMAVDDYGAFGLGVAAPAFPDVAGKYDPSGLVLDGGRGGAFELGGLDIRY